MQKINNDDFRIVMFSWGPISEHRLLALKKYTQKEVLDKIIIITDSYNWLEKVSDTFQILLVDDIRRDEYSFKYEQFPDSNKSIDYLRKEIDNWNEDGFYRKFSRENNFPYLTLPIPVFRYIIPYLAEQGISTFLITGTDTVFNTIESVQQGINDLPVGSLLSAWGPYPGNNGEYFKNFYDFYEKNYTDIKLPNKGDEAMQHESHFRGGKFKSIDDMMLFYNMWNDYMKHMYCSEDNDLYIEFYDPHIVLDDKLMAFIYETFKANSQYKIISTVTNDEFSYNDVAAKIGVHIYREIDKMFYRPWTGDMKNHTEAWRDMHPQTEWNKIVDNINWSDTESYTNFLKNNKDLVNRMMPHYTRHSINFFCDYDVDLIYRLGKFDK